MKKLIEDVTKFQREKGCWRDGASPQPGHLTHEIETDRIKFLSEELMEYRDAVAAGDLAAQGDALIDLIYVAIGTGLMKGLPLEAMWDEVQRANMEKEQVGAPGYKGGLIKPVGWLPPQHEPLLAAAGYNKSVWLLPCQCGVPDCVYINRVRAYDFRK